MLCVGSARGKRGVVRLLDDETADRFSTAEPQVIVIEFHEGKSRGTVSDAGKSVGKFEIASGSGQTRSCSQERRQFFDGDVTQLHDVSLAHNHTLSQVEPQMLPLATKMLPLT